MSKNKVIKATIIHSICYRTLPIPKALRYCLSFFISGLFFFIISFKSEINSYSQSILQIFASLLIMISIYSFPYFEVEKIDKYVSSFLKYIGLLILFMLHSQFWYAFCSSETINNIIIVLTAILSITEIFIIVPLINCTLKPLLFVINKISSEIKDKAKSNEESCHITYIKTFCANVSIIISFVLTMITFFTTIGGLINPSEIIDKHLK